MIFIHSSIITVYMQGLTGRFSGIWNNTSTTRNTPNKLVIVGKIYRPAGQTPLPHPTERFPTAQVTGA